MKKGTKKLTMFGFLFLTGSVLVEIYEYPTFATSGFSAVFFLLVGGFFWFLPVVLAAAEMATVDGFEDGGVFTWTGKTLGERWGFAHIFFQFMVFTIGAITMIYFIIGAVSYVTGWTALNSDPLIKFLAVIAIFWAITAVQLSGVKNTARIAKIGFIGGVLIPGAILLILSAIYIFKGNPIDVVISTKTFLPDFSKASTLVVLVSFMLSYMGVEVSATHVKDMKNPKRDYPIAVIILLVLAIILNTVGALSVAAVVPQSQLSLNEGVFQTFSYLFAYIGHYSWAVDIIAILLAIGSVAEVSSWIIGPSRGLSTAGDAGIIPKSIAKRNSHDVAPKILIIQGVIVTIWAAVLTFGGGSSNTSFFMAMTLTVIVYLAAYFLFFLAYIKLVLKHSDMKRSYEIPGGKVVKLIFAVVGLITTVIAFVISFLPPAGLPSKSIESYTILLVVCFVVIMIIPFVIYACRGKWNKEKNLENEKIENSTVDVI
ncbi:MAG: amino acid permease [Sarcina sp.]